MRSPPDPSKYAAILLLSATAGTAGCAGFFGPAHGYVTLVGEAPVATSCLVSATPVDSEAATREQPVSGVFRERVILNPSRKGHEAVLVCDGEVVASRRFRYGRDLGFGDELHLTIAAP